MTLKPAANFLGCTLYAQTEPLYPYNIVLAYFLGCRVLFPCLAGKGLLMLVVIHFNLEFASNARARQCQCCQTMFQIEVVKHRQIVPHCYAKI